MEQQATLSLALTDAPAVPENRRLAIDLRRHDIEMALRSADDGLELLLDLEAGEVNGGTTRRHTLAIGCTREDLERMLENAGDDVSVGFDADALAWAIRDPDTEAHGLREKMAVLAVVLATTGAAAGSAQAMPTLGGQGGGSDGTALTSTRDMPADSMSASVASTEGAPATRANPSDAAAATIAQEARLAEQVRLDLRHDEVLSASHHAAPPLVTDPAHDLPSDSVQASQVPPLAHGVAATGSSSVDSSTFVVVGGIALVLLGAGFAAAAANRRTPRPT